VAAAVSSDLESVVTPAPKSTLNDLIPDTINSTSASRIDWDVVVVGAGPAGTIAALELARSGATVLLVDRQQFPREKVCGGCLNGQALAVLDQAGLTEALEEMGGPRLTEFRLGVRGHQVSIPLPVGIAVSRREFDAMLVLAAIKAGVAFCSGIDVRVGSIHGDRRVVNLNSGGAVETARARTVVLATGLTARRPTGEQNLQLRESTRSRVGIAASATVFPADYSAGTIFMAVDRCGYVGLTVLENGRLNVAAAIDRDRLRAGDPRSACEQILRSAGFPEIQELQSAEWSGTVGLTRTGSQPAAERLFVAGDAAGYIEPFTGQGMAWALTGGREVVPFVRRSLDDWSPELERQWCRVWKRTIRRRQRLCRLLATTLRHPMMVASAVRLLGAVPALASPVVAMLNRSQVVPT
jgi:flavin-dependent dehydrogenase